MPAQARKAKASVPTRDRILDAAEHLFAELSFDGASIRDIAVRADVRLGLVSYYFSSKEVLYEKVIERRAAEIGQARLTLLAQENRSCAPAPIPVERIIHAYIWPSLERSRDAGEGWRSYTKLIATVVNTQRWAPMLSGYHDPVARTFITELRRTLPHCSSEVVITAFTFMVSVMQGVIAQTERARVLSDGKIDWADLHSIADWMITFSAGGLKALVAGTDPDKAVLPDGAVASTMSPRGFSS